MNLLRLLSWHTDVELRDDDDEEPEEDLPAVEWTRQRVPTDQERRTYDEGLRRHVEQLSAVVDPFRPRLQPWLSRQVTPETTPVWTKEPPDAPGTWWVRVPGHQRKVVEVYRRNGELWLRWSDVPAAKVPRTGLEWGSRPIVSPVEPR